MSSPKARKREPFCSVDVWFNKKFQQKKRDQQVGVRVN